MPTAFNDAEGAVGSIADVSGANGDFGIRYTLADVLGSGFKLDYNYVPKHGTGDATGDGGPGGEVNGAENSKDAHDITLTGSVPGVDGLNVGLGYSRKNYGTKSVTLNNSKQENGTAYVTYATGPITVGVQLGMQGDASGGDGTHYRNQYMGISYAISDDLSVAYNRTESRKQVGTETGPPSQIDQEWENFSLSYSMGGMTIGLSDSDCSNCSYTVGSSLEETVLNLTVAF
jgi:hypothetical protein